MKWNTEHSLLLIKEYEKYQLLWYSKYKDHFNKLKKIDAWREIAKSCNMDIDEVLY